MTEARRDTWIRLAGLAASAAYALLIGWLVVGQPQTMAEVSGGLTSQVGLYRVDQASFAEGLRFFRADQFAEARLAFERADPAHRDPTTQFYVAYAFYREGWGRLYDDDELFRRGLEALDRAERASPESRVVVDDPTLGLQTSDELRVELGRGLERDLSDLNPLKVFRARK